MGYQGDETTGFQSPAQDHVEGVVDLAAMLELRRPGRYPVRVHGEGLVSRGIFDGDILVADAAAPPAHNGVCIAIVGADVVVATLTRADDGWTLTTGQGAVVPVDDAVEIWAMVEALVRVEI